MVQRTPIQGIGGQPPGLAVTLSLCKKFSKNPTLLALGMEGNSLTPGALTVHSAKTSLPSCSLLLTGAHADRASVAP